MIILVLLYSFVQAATEFLPVSSSGHLVLLHAIIPLKDIDPLTFDISLHWGTLLAVLVYFRRDLAELFRGWMRSIARASVAGDHQGKFAWMILIANIFPALVGAVFGGAIEDATRRPMVVVITLVAGAILLLVADRFGRQSKGIAQVTMTDAILIGASQMIAFIPGVSRSGISIITALARNLNRTAAVRLSFLLSVPIIFAAGVKELVEYLRQGATLAASWGMLLGLLCSAIFGYLVIAFLLRYVERHTFRLFAVYRIAIAVLMLVIF